VSHHRLPIKKRLFSALIASAVAGASMTGSAGRSMAQEPEPAGIVLITSFNAEVPPAPAASDEHTNAPHDDHSHAMGFDPYATVGMLDLEGYPVGQNPFADRVQYDPSLPEEEHVGNWEILEPVFDLLETPIDPLGELFGGLLGAKHLETHSELNPHPIGLQPIPQRPDLLLEWNEKFLGPGELAQGIETPTGAIWRPSFWVFGTYRSALGYRDNRRGRNFTEVANRLDLFGQLNLSGTERVLVGLRPLDYEVGNRRVFSGYDFHDGDSINGFNSDIQTLFFEGDFGEIFPSLDWFDHKQLDYGFSVGRQPMSFQDGLLINEDMMDAVTVTRNTLNGDGLLNLRATGAYAWENINRNNNMPDPDAQLVGLFTEADFEHYTVSIDAAYVDSPSRFGSLFAVGASADRRFHGFHNTYNSSAHILTSVPTQNETAASGRGTLLFHQLSWTPHHREDLVYVNTFWAIDQFTSPARGPLMGGPLGQVGILFAAPALGQFGAPLSNQASEAYGGSIGYQLLFNSIIDSQVIVEVGGRKDTNNLNQGELGTALQYQQKLNEHWLLRVDGFLTVRETEGVGPGTRFEVLAKF
jgi:hypothetical protein